MKKLLKAITEGLLPLLVLGVAVVVPALMLIFGIGSLFFTDQPAFFALLIYAGVVVVVVAAAAALVMHPRAGPYAKVVISVLLVVAFVSHCAKQGKSTGGDCVPSRYVDCD